MCDPALDVTFSVELRILDSNIIGRTIPVRNAPNRNFRISLALTILLTTAASIPAQTKVNRWNLAVDLANLKPFVCNDRWFITPEGYHIHPASEHYTPGLRLGIERRITGGTGLELNLLYGLAPAYLGVIDEFSAIDLEFHDTQRYHFFAILLSTNFYVLRGDFGSIYVSPTAGYGLLSEKTVTPTFGPPVTWIYNCEWIYGIRTGIKFRLKNPNLSFNLELFMLSMKSKLVEVQSGRVLRKTFGPFGLLLGFTFAQ